MVRFAPAAVAALTATAVVYFLCGSVWHLTGRVTGAAGWLAGAVVSYGVSRWAWERRGRPRVLREMVPFVAVSVAAGAVLIEASHLGYAAAAALGLHGLAFYAFAEGCYLAANCVTFIVRFVIFNFVVFADGAAGWDLRRVWPARVLPAGARAALSELVKFGVVGAFTVLLSKAAVSLLVMQVGALASTVAAALLATGVSFAGNRYWTFRHRLRTTVGRDGGRYVMLSAAGLVIQAACIQVAARPLGLPAALALGLGLSFCFRFWLCRAWVWRAPWPGSSVMA